MSESVILGSAIRHKQRERDQLQRDLEEFQARGGTVEELSPHTLSDRGWDLSFRETNKALNERGKPR